MRNLRRPADRPRTSCLVSCCLAAACCHSALADWPEGFGPNVVATLYVDDDAPPGGDGLSWATAFDSLHDALDEAGLIPTPGSQETVQIRMGGGLYVPEVRIDPGDPRSAAFIARPGRVEIFGGFAGFGSVDPDANDPALHETVLSGDLAGDDEPAFVNRDDNAYHILTADFGVGGGNSGTYLRNLTLRGGNATDVPGATVGNQMGFGGAVRLSEVNMLNCFVTENEAEQGGAIGGGSYIRVYDSIFLQNQSATFGGAIGSYGGGEIISAFNTRFLGNRSGLGGAISMDAFLNQSLVGCEFSGNIAQGASIATSGGGAVFARGSSDIIRIYQCSFVNNAAPNGQGGALAVANGNLALTNCALAGNTDITGSGLDAQAAGTKITIRSSLVHGFVSDSPYIIALSPPSLVTPTFDGDPMFVDPLGPDGIAGTLDDDLRPAAGSPLIDAGAASQLASGMNPGDMTIGGEARIVEDPTRPNIANPGAPFYLGPIDIGAYEYQRDDDSNGILDSVQIASDPSLDCDANGVLDAFEAFSDCDNNGINDRCQIAGDPSLDLNRNGVLDECDIDSGTSEDENSNGIPDENEPALRFVNGSRVIGSGVEDGRSWATAYASLDAALDDAAGRLAPTEVWVTGGVYTPTGFGEGRSRAFHIRGDTKLLGGFAGDEEHADQRDPVANPTVLSGDFNQDDTDGGTNEENALHVVIGPRFGEHAMIDGFVVERGNADLFDSSLMISGFSNFPGYWPDAAGGGVLGMSGDLTMPGCIVRHNSARLGGAAIHAGPSSYWDGSSVGVVALMLADTAFEDNTFEYQDGFSAFAASCVFSAARSVVDIDRCSFIGNAGGSAISIRGVINSSDILSTGYTASPSLDLRNSLLGANDSILSTGSVLALVSGSGANQNNFRAVNNTIAYNNSKGISIPPQGLLANSIIWGNMGDSGATETDQISINATGSVRNTIIEGWTGTLPGTHVSVSGADPMFADSSNGDLHLSPASPAIDAGDNNHLALAVLYDLDGNDRFINDCATPDTGVADGLRPLVDLGAFEFQAASIMGDANADGVIDVTDLNLVLSLWMSAVDPPGLGGDVSRDGFVDMDDLNLVLGAWASECE